MATYVTRDEIVAAIPSTYIDGSVDDDGNTTPDTGVLDVVIQMASQRVDAISTTQLTAAQQHHAAFVFACEYLYLRRGMGGDANPWKGAAEQLTEELSKSATNTAPLIFSGMAPRLIRNVYDGDPV